MPFMSKSVLSRIAFAAGALILAALGTVNSGLIPRHASAFTTLTVMNTADSGSGSLRDTIAAANPGDTIGFGLTQPAPVKQHDRPVHVHPVLGRFHPNWNRYGWAGKRH